MSIENNIKALGIELPVLQIPKAAYKPYIICDRTLAISGQLPVKDGSPIAMGSVPDSVTVEDAKAAARLCALNVLSWTRHACDGDWGRVTRLLKVGGYVVTSQGYSNAPEIINAASEIFTAVFGEAGEHARIAIGVASLPLGVPVEVEATFILRGK